MTECQACSARAELYLCPHCIAELRADLLSLAQGPYVTTVGGHTKSGGDWHIERRTPGLLANLADVINRQTRTGRGSGHRKRGDEMPGLYEPDTENGRETRQGRATTLMHAAHKSLTTLVRDLCESRGVTTPATDLEGCATFLARHAHALASTDSAGQTKRGIDTLCRRITKVIDRPPAPRLCGQCDHMDDGKMCRTMLYAHPDAIEISCPDCHTVHNVERLSTSWLGYIDEQILDRTAIIGNQRTSNPELYDTGIMGALDEEVHWQTFNRWVREGHLRAVRYVRPGGRRSFTRHTPDDLPEYRVGDVRAVRRKMERGTKATAG